MNKLLIVAILSMLLSLPSAAQDFDFKEVDYTPEKTTFQLFAPMKAKRVTLRLFGDKERVVKMKRLKKQGIWTATVKGDLKGTEYAFDAGYGETPGVFAKAVSVNGKRGVVLPMADTNPEGWANDKRPVTASPADLVIYEMHHRDFSVGASATDSYGNKKEKGFQYAGKFLALTEPKAIDHLKQLGVNAIHILPSYDYGSVDETRLDKPQYNWGYDPVNYNVPEGSYSTNPYNPISRIREFKQMVMALHKAGIRVILDVVYNHTYDIEHANFQKTYPDYFYRKNADGSYSNGSGCGNETASEQPLMRRFIIESVKYWINEYHIDGFRFDLMGCHDIETMNEIRKAVDSIDPTLFIYGEGWSAGACALPQEQLGIKANISMMPRIAAFSDEMRDGLRGPFSDDTKGAFLAGLKGSEESIKFGIVGCINHPQVDMTRVNYSKKAWADEPTQMIAYVSCHDDMCLTDRLRASIPNITSDEIIRLDLLAQTVVFTSQGVPFMLSGEEMLRDKKGVHNSFESPDSVNRLDWSNLKRYPQVFNYYKELISLRKNHPAFRLAKADLVRRHLEFLPGADNLIAFRLKDHAGGDDWKDIIVAFNGNHEARSINIPDDNWTIVCDDGRINEQGLGYVKGAVATVAPQSALIIYR